MFYPEKGGSPAAALKICKRCPVQKECLQYAMDNNEIYGIWGGTTEMQRRQMRRERRKQIVRRGRVA